MKTRISSIIAMAAAAVLSLVSCNKFLDTMPDNRTEIDSQQKIQSLLTSAYSSNTYLTFCEYMCDNVDNLGDDNPGTDRFIDQCYSWERITEKANDCPDYFWSDSYS